MSAQLQISPFFAQRYVLGSVIGQGGMGYIQQATDIQARDAAQIVAIKFPWAHLISDETLVRRFMLEGQLLWRLSHPHVIRCYDYGIYEGYPYLVFELLGRGCNLEKTIRNSWCTRRQQLSIALQLVSALRYIHQQGIAHRDIKANNVWVSWRDDGSPWVTLFDFGIARDMRARTRITLPPSLTPGTPSMMPPETIFIDAEITLDTFAACDLYQLGEVLIELLTGAVYFSGPSLREILKKKKERPPLEHIKVQSPVLANCLAGLLAPEAEDRPTIDEVESILQTELQACS
jgi:serine/threonine-protein kinase